MVHESNSIRATIASLRSLRSPDHFDTVQPTHVAVPFRARSGRGVAPLADIWTPEPGTRVEPSPSVVLVHGGGFLIGSRSMKPMRLLASALVRRGFSVCSLDYRLVFRGGRLAEATADVVAGLRWWSEQAERFGTDPGRIGVVGLSAGGALALIAAGHEAAPAIERTVGVFGLYDFSGLGGAVFTRLPRLITRSADPSDWRAASPIEAAQPTGPVLLLHGTGDTVVPAQQTEALAQRRREQGLPTEITLYDGAPHAFLNTPGPVADQALERILGFLAPLAEQRSAA